MSSRALLYERFWDRVREQADAGLDRSPAGPGWDGADFSEWTSVLAAGIERRLEDPAAADLTPLEHQALAWVGDRDAYWPDYVRENLHLFRDALLANEQWLRPPRPGNGTLSWSEGPGPDDQALFHHDVEPRRVTVGRAVEKDTVPADDTYRTRNGLLDLSLAHSDEAVLSGRAFTFHAVRDELGPSPLLPWPPGDLLSVRADVSDAAS